MKSLRDYISESEYWSLVPSDGDEFLIELEDGTVVDTYIIEATTDSILLDATPQIISALTEWAELADCESDESQVILEMGYGGLTHESDDEQLNEFLPVLGALAGRAIVGAGAGALTRIGASLAGHAVGSEIEDALTSDNDQEVDEAEYHGKHVTLNKPTRGDVKKFKVYVKDPSTGNIKKVNFGHGGKTARRLGQKTMRIKKSNPARRKSFRARHHCENPGPKTKARYWSCRAW